jgi:multiple sugar transport system permease protein
LTVAAIAPAQTRRGGVLTSRRARTRLAAAGVHALLLGGAALMLLPLGWMLSTSLKEAGDVFLYPPAWVPNPVRWANYRDIFTTVPFARFFLNTVVITMLDVVGKTLSCSLVAFSFARLRWRGRDALFLVMLATLMLPQHVTLIPQFILYKQLGLVDTFVPLVLPNFLGGPFLTFLMRQFFMGVPTELDDAARIDGASTFQIYWRILLPLARPALAAVAIFTFNASWNDFLGPLIYLHSRDNYTVALGLRSFQQEHGTDWNLLMAASLVAMVPVLAIFFAAQKYFIQGIVFTGVKG